jgi:Protein of unknown function (DUF1501)
MPLSPYQIVAKSSQLSRRQALQRVGAGFGMVALKGLLADEARAGSQNHFPARAKRIIWLFMGGGPSHIDSFDPKPLLEKYHGKKIPIKLPGHLRDGSDVVLGSPFKFKQYGQSGISVSELFPHLARQVDKLCVIRSMHCDSIDHTGATLQTFCGSVAQPRPGIGNWLLYGLGSENKNLPGYVVMGPDQQSGTATYSPRFLPGSTAGTRVNWDYSATVTAHNALPNLRNSGGLTQAEQRSQLDLIRSINGSYAEGRVGIDPLSARMETYELAFRMQTSAPEAFDISGESAATKSLYGLDNPLCQSYGYRCLLARRLAERGVRFIQLQCGKGDGLDWDQHGELESGHRHNALATDQPVAGLLQDLHSRGLLKDTLVVWGGEFGRTPTSQGKDGREHHPHGYTLCLAGGGVKAGSIYGATDDFGWYATENKMHINDFHATLLHLMGLDHEKLTYHYSGRDFRLTDVAGNVAHSILS